MGSLLIVHGDPRVRSQLETHLRRHGHHVEGLADAAAISAALARQAFDVVLVDIDTTEADPSGLLCDVLQHFPDARVAVSATHPTVPHVVEAMRAGAYDYLDSAHLSRRLELLLRQLSDTPPARRRDSRTPSSDSAPLLESANPRMARALATARQVAESDVPLLLIGESGTGKKTLTAAIHSWSPRRAAPLITAWCAALTEHPLDGGLLEHLHGALTWNRTVGSSRRRVALSGGTLFLDEAGNGNLPGSFQVKLLRYLEDQQCGRGVGPEIDARIIVGSAHALEADVRAGRLREDLFFRLNVVAIALPPLRERGEDLPKLRDQLLANLCARHRRSGVQLTPEAERVLAGYHWPGNVRELATVLERAIVFSRGKTLGAEDIVASLSAPAVPEARVPSVPSLSLSEVEQQQIQRVLEVSTTLGEAAARLGIDPATLWRKRKRYGLDRPRAAERSAKQG